MKKDYLLNFLKNDYQYNCHLNFLLDKFTISEIINEIIDLLTKNKHSYIDILSFTRDFYIGSDLDKKSKNEFYTELKKQRFFKILETNLYSNDFKKISYSIYTIGKFSDNDNSIFLENLYESEKISNNIFLSYRCLIELDWLNSKKLYDYIDRLKKVDSLFSNFTLLYFYDTRNESNEIEKILIKENFKNIFKSKKFIKNELFINLMELESTYNKIEKNNFDNIDVENLINLLFQDK